MPKITGLINGKFFQVLKSDIRLAANIKLENNLINVLDDFSPYISLQHYYSIISVYSSNLQLFTNFSMSNNLVEVTNFELYNNVEFIEIYEGSHNLENFYYNSNSIMTACFIYFTAASVNIL